MRRITRKRLLTTNEAKKYQAIRDKVAKEYPPKACVVCGADVVKSRRRRDESFGDNDTCDPVCTRAKKSGRTREQQYWADEEPTQT